MLNKTAIILLFLFKCNQVQCDVNCESLRNCLQCIHAPSCGWYLQYRSINGSGCFQNERMPDAQSGYFHSPKASFHILKNKNNTVITPQEVSINLRLNEPFTFPITFTRRDKSTVRRSVELKHNLRRSRIIKLHTFSNCNKQDELIETDRCDEVETGSSVEFLIKVEQTKCSKRQPERIRQIEINVSPGDVILKINLYAFCQCPCEMKNWENKSELPDAIPDCHKRGRFICGVCYCNDGFAGKNCEINTTNNISS